MDENKIEHVQTEEEVQNLQEGKIETVVEPEVVTPEIVDPVSDVKVCGTCDGKGRVSDTESCVECNGSGKLS